MATEYELITRGMAAAADLLLRENMFSAAYVVLQEINNRQKLVCPALSKS